MYIGKHVKKEYLVAMIYTMAVMEYGYPVPDDAQLPPIKGEDSMHNEYRASVKIGRSQHYMESYWPTKKQAKDWLDMQLKWAADNRQPVTGAKIFKLTVSDIFDRLEDEHDDSNVDPGSIRRCPMDKITAQQG